MEHLLSRGFWGAVAAGGIRTPALLQASALDWHHEPFELLLEFFMEHLKNT